MSSTCARQNLDAVFKAYDVRGTVPDQVDEELARAVGGALVRVTGAEGSGVVVGHDMRPSSPGMARAFAEGASAAGADVRLIGLASTDELYFASGWFDLPGAMFTASHNPARYNGIKMCRAGAVPIGRDTGLADIRDLVASGEPVRGSRTGTVTEVDVLDEYAGYLLSHEANPIDPANLRDLQAKVRESGADLGLAFDGDADRCFLVDERGERVDPSALTALIAARELAKQPGATVIHNLITSRAVPQIVTELGGTPVRTRVGHSFIKATMAETDAVFGGEHSGHFYFRDFWRADTGMLAALHALAALAGSDRPMSELVGEYSRFCASGEINSAVADQQSAMDRIEREYDGQPGVTIDHLDGLTVSHDDWWFNVRPSNTEPLLRLNAEARDDTTMSRLRDHVLATIRSDS